MPKIPTEPEKKVAPEEEHKEPQIMRHAKRSSGYRVDRLTPQEAALANKERFVRFSVNQLTVIMDKAKGIPNAETAKKINRTEKTTANIRTKTKEEWQDHYN